MERIYFTDETKATEAEAVINASISSFKGRAARWCKPQTDRQGNWFIMVDDAKKGLLNDADYSTKPISSVDEYDYTSWIKRVDLIAEYFKPDNPSVGSEKSPAQSNDISDFFRNNKDVVNDWIANGGQDLSIVISEEKSDFWTKIKGGKSRQEKMLEAIQSLS